MKPAWRLAAPVEVRPAYIKERNSGNAERLQALAWFVALVFAILAIQHLLSPGVPRDSYLFPGYLVMYFIMILAALAFAVSSRIFARRRSSSLMQWLFVSFMLAGLTALAVLDVSVSGDQSSMLLGLFGIAVLFRCRPAGFAIAAALVYSAFIAGTWLILGKIIEAGFSIPLLLECATAIVLSMALGHYDIRTFLLQVSLETARSRLEEEIAAKGRDAAELAKALVQRDALFKELQHRVKNSLAMVSSFLSLDEDRVDEASRETIRQAQGRIQTLSALYERLYRSGELDSVDFALYASDILAMFLASNPLDPDRIRVHSSLDELRIDLRRAIPLGLILNELLTNAAKHAFPDGRSGSIAIGFKGQGSQALLSVHDDGIGLPPGFAPEDTDSLGMKVVSLLSQQIGATLRFDGGPGTRVEISFALT